MAIDTVKLINYLAFDVSQEQISSALGITPGYVSQLVMQESVKDLVRARKAEIASEEADKEANLRTASATLLGTIVGLASDVDSIGEAVRAYEILDKLMNNEKAKDGEAVRAGKMAKTLIVSVPVFVQQNLNIEVDSKNQITEIAGRSMATLSTSDTYKLLQGLGKPEKDIKDMGEISLSEEEW